MENKTQGDFQNDVLEILKKDKEDREKFQKDLIGRVEKLENIKPEMLPTQKEKLTWVCNLESIQNPNNPPLTQEQLQEKAAGITRDVGPILKMHKISRLEMFLTKIYE